MKKVVNIVFKTALALFVIVNAVLAFHAYKFTHYYNANEVVEKSESDKTRWEIAKEIIFGINAAKKPTAYITDTSFKNIFLSTADKLKLEGWYSTTDSVAKGTVLLFHGHHSNRFGVIAESEAFKRMGYNTLLLDFRAHGNSEGNTCTIGFYEAEDVKLAYDFIRSKGEKNVVLWGISMGAAAITKAVNDYQLNANKIILEMPYGTLVQAAEGKLKTMHLPAEPLSSILIFWGGIENGFWAFNMKPVEYVKKVTSPVLLQWGKNDPRVTKQETEEVYKNISTAKKLVVYDHCGHQSLCVGEPEKWQTEVNNFLQQK